MLIATGKKNDKAQTIFVGENYPDFPYLLKQELEPLGFIACKHEKHNLSGENPQNICNRGQRRIGM